MGGSISPEVNPLPIAITGEVYDFICAIRAVLTA